MSPLRLLALPATLAVLGATPSLAATNGKYKGKTDQNRAVTFTIKNNKVRAFQAGVMAYCSASGGFRTDALANLPAIPIKGSRFDLVHKTDAGEFEVHGKVSGTRVTGTVSLWRGDSSFENGMTKFGSCSAMDRKFTARR